MTIHELASHSIGLFDSGLGGLTVLRQLLQKTPQEQFIYFGDTARLPYGEKSRETIIRYSLEIARFLVAQQIKLLVVACSTASSLALQALREHLDIPVMGMIDPGAESVVRATRSGYVAVLGTKGTIKSEAYKKAILQKDPHAVVASIACPLFVPLVEEEFINHKAARLIVHEYLKPLRGKQIDTILLGCTHYPLLKDLICDEMGEEVSVIDPAIACAEEIKKILDKHRSHQIQHPIEHRFFVSDDPEKFQKLGETFLGRRISQVESVLMCDSNSFEPSFK